MSPRRLFANGVAAVIAACGLASAAQAGPNIYWQGSTQLTLVTSACTVNKALVFAANFLATFQAKVSASDERSSLMFVLPYGAVLGTTTSTAYPSPWTGSYDGVVINSNASGGPYAGGTYTFNATPSLIFTTTPKIDMTGTITKFAGITGCTIKFRGTFYKAL